MEIVISLAVIVGLIPVTLALFGRGLWRWLSFGCAALMLFGLLAPPAAVIAWLLAMVFSVKSIKARRRPRVASTTG